MPAQTGEWFLPRRSENGHSCVQTKFTDAAVYARNNQRPDEGTAEFTHEEWTAFVAGVEDGD